MLGLKFTHMTSLKPREVVGRGSETQFQVGKKINYMTERFEG